MSIFKSLSESISGVGYSSSGTDSFPRLSMTECVGEFGVYLEEAIGINEAASNYELMSSVEAILSESVDIETLDENMWESFKARVKQIFDSIVKFINSIVAKVNEFIAKHTSSLGYVTKYEAEMKKKDLTGFEFEGYDFGDMQVEELIPSKIDVNQTIIKAARDAISSEKANALMQGIEMIGSKNFSPSEGWTSAEAKDGSDKKERWTNIREAIGELNSEPEAFKIGVYAQYAITLNNSSELQSEMMEAFRGKDKVKLSVNVPQLIERLKNYKTFITIKNGYKSLVDDVNKARAELQKALDEASKKSKVAIKDNKEDSQKLSNLLGEFNSFAKGYLSLYTKSIACINNIRNVVISAAKEQRKQDLELAKKIIAYKSESKSESFSYDDDLNITVYGN